MATRTPSRRAWREQYDQVQKNDRQKSESNAKLKAKILAYEKRPH
jgi:hypothetical protein